MDVALGEVPERHDPAAVGGERAADRRHQLVERADRHGDVELERHALGVDRLGDPVAERDEPLARRSLGRHGGVLDLTEAGERAEQRVGGILVVGELDDDVGAASTASPAGGVAPRWAATTAIASGRISSTASRFGTPPRSAVEHRDGVGQRLSSPPSQSPCAGTTARASGGPR